ncbi:hypothetical protein M0R45_002819 [Rubus argutus]|uniref:Uncharacterized protein n=1 Tax=Rubus argutus TaxID=59490 RepID=A0AAW1VQI9_RUBAR
MVALFWVPIVGREQGAKRPWLIRFCEGVTSSPVSSTHDSIASEILHDSTGEAIGCLSAREENIKKHGDFVSNPDILKFGGFHGEVGRPEIGNLRKQDVHAEERVEGSFPTNSSNGDDKVTEDG